MTVDELIEVLRNYPRGMPVVTPGFDESGYDLIGKPEIIRIDYDENGGGHDGQFKAADDDHPSHRLRGKPFDALLINF